MWACSVLCFPWGSHPYPSQHPSGEYPPTFSIAANSCDSENHFQGNQKEKKKFPASGEISTTKQAVPKEHPQHPGCSFELPALSAPSSRDKCKRDICAGVWRGNGCFPKAEIKVINIICCLALGPLQQRTQKKREKVSRSLFFFTRECVLISLLHSQVGFREGIAISELCDNRAYLRGFLLEAASPLGVLRTQYSVLRFGFHTQDLVTYGFLEAHST
jgi:hypothetical protein